MGKIEESSFLEVDIQHLENVHNFHNDLSFLPERKKIKKFEMFSAILHDKTEYVIHTKDLKQALNLGLVLKNFIVSLILIKKIAQNHILT